MPARRHKLLLPLLGAGLLLVAGATAGAVVLFSGAFETAATKQHFRITHWLLEAGLHNSIRVRAARITAPPLDRPGLVEQGLACYREHCAHCHGAPGVAPAAGTSGLLPVPASLAQTARDWPAEWLYYVTSKGVRMTGMPAWETRLPEESLWGTVAFLRELPVLTPAEYAARSAAVPERCAARTDLPDVDPDELGDVLLRQYACHSCHVIDGVTGPRSSTGPPLRAWAGRAFIAGTLPNTAENLALWISDPRAVSPGTLMPDMGVPPAHAAAMAAFLFAQR